MGRTKIKNNCFYCKYSFQAKECVKCAHPSRNMEGRGAYINPMGYDQCDCGGFEKKIN